MRSSRFSRKSQGFTLVELLIVIVIIGALATIAIAQWAKTKERAYEAAAKNDLRNLIAAEEKYFAETQAYTNAVVPVGGFVDLDADGTPDMQASVQIGLAVTAYTDGVQATASHTASTFTWCINSSSSNATGPAGMIVLATSC